MTDQKENILKSPVAWLISGLSVLYLVLVLMPQKFWVSLSLLLFK